MDQKKIYFTEALRLLTHIRKGLSQKSITPTLIAKMKRYTRESSVMLPKYVHKPMQLYMHLLQLQNPNPDIMQARRAQLQTIVTTFMNKASAYLAKAEKKPKSRRTQSGGNDDREGGDDFDFDNNDESSDLEL